MLGKLDREDVAGMSTGRSLAFTLVLAACVVLILCFPVSATNISRTTPTGEDGFQEAIILPQYLAEGTTYGGMETWVVVFNPGPNDAIVDLTFYADNVEVAGPQDVSVPKGHRKSFLLNSLVPDKKDVSTRVSSSGGPVDCERSVYGPGRAWAHNSRGMASWVIPSCWYLAEGTTYGGMETWVVVFNPDPVDAIFDLTFYTDGGQEVAGPQNFSLPKGHRHSFYLNSMVPNKKDVSTKVSCDSGGVICERAVYGPGKAWAHDSLGVNGSYNKWYLAEGTTYGGMETWVVVFNPGPGDAIVDLTFYADNVEVAGPQNCSLPSGHRQAFLLHSLVPNKKDVSTVVSCDSGAVVCERAVYGPGRIWAHEARASTYDSFWWCLAEGTTYGGMETWVVVFNPNPSDAIVDLTFYADNVEVAGPQDISIPKGHRQSFLLNSLVPNKKDVSTVVSASGAQVICERAVYGPGRIWAHASLGEGD